MKSQKDELQVKYCKINISAIIAIMSLLSLSVFAISLEATADEFVVTGKSVSTLSAFDDTMKTFMAGSGISQGSLAVAKDGKLMLARGYTNTTLGGKPTDPTTLFRIASISKPITATAIMKMVQDGKLKLSDKLVDLLSVKNPLDTRLNEVTVLHLLQHLGGWDLNQTFDPMFYDETIGLILQKSLPINKQDIAKYMNNDALQHTPGTTYAYSNYGYMLLGLIIEKISGMSYDSYVKKEILLPLKIHSMQTGKTLLGFRLPNEAYYTVSSYAYSVFDNSYTKVPGPYGGFNLENMDSHGGWLASAVDLAKFATIFDNNSAAGVLNSDSVEKMFALPSNMSAQGYNKGDAYYGCGWFARDYGSGYRNTWHFGALEGTFTLLVRRGDGLTWAALFNVYPSSTAISDIDSALHDAANSISQWPQDDLFNTYLSSIEQNPVASFSYDTSVLSIDEVFLSSGDMYSANMRLVSYDPIMLELTDAKKITDFDSYSPARYDEDNLLLYIPNISISAEIYEATLEYQQSGGKSRFSVDSMGKKH